MSAVVDLRAEHDARAMTAAAPRARTAPARITLLGTGTVGSAVVARVSALHERGIAVPAIAWLSNSRVVRECRGDAAAALDDARAAPAARSTISATDALRPGDFVIDATASDTVAARHAAWLAQGIHVVTANKLGIGAGAARADAIAAAQRIGRARYGDAATVGAGLPLLRTIRELVAGGDRIHAIEGVLSGSLAWLFAHFDGTGPFSDLVREARAAGYTEPDPRGDLSGGDVRRKLLILARAAGLAIDAAGVEVESLIPEQLPDALRDADIDRVLEALDAPVARHFREAQRDDAVLCFVGRIDARGASVGLQALPRAHALRGGSGTDNRVAIHSDRYRSQPLVIQGPGAGSDVTAAALIDDVLRIARDGSRSRHQVL